MLQPEVLEVDADLPDLGEERGQLARAVVDEHDERREACILAVLAGEARDAGVARGEDLGHGSPGAGTVVVPERLAEPVEVGGERVEVPLAAVGKSHVVWNPVKTP